MEWVLSHLKTEVESNEKHGHFGTKSESLARIAKQNTRKDDLSSL